MLGHLFYRLGALDSPPPVSIVSPVSPVPASHPAAAPCLPLERRLVEHLNRRQTHRGHDLRLIAPTGHPNAHPRQGVPTKWWSWRDVMGFAWQCSRGQGPEHINVFECRALVAALDTAFFTYPILKSWCPLFPTAGLLAGPFRPCLCGARLISWRPVPGLSPVGVHAVRLEPI